MKETFGHKERLKLTPKGWKEFNAIICENAEDYKASIKLILEKPMKETFGHKSKIEVTPKGWIVFIIVFFMLVFFIIGITALVKWIF